eukprot:CAMPEP_0172530180 /NCGR_PEP_ID=MMETSP1067-20121228/3995_1 /TAXON_ID=265564 ORGANISM="Thalassiosira punctigera, Strain Tpunct2005C2" /NCGR_SAMPLE_ID=MMETSP1067 /ASSEMBLY_ACC=CAM_ASM_000444 /LENGTH=161 /DNA_ID=CAMNT_0013314335 /DNA_START=660 /DNA_END=1141 /DNA_ORIENTATION=-
MDHDAKERAGVARVEDEDQWPCVPPKKGLDAMGKLGAMGGIETFRTSVVPSPALPRFVTTIPPTRSRRYEPWSSRRENTNRFFVIEKQRNKTSMKYAYLDHATLPHSAPAKALTFNTHRRRRIHPSFFLIPVVILVPALDVVNVACQYRPLCPHLNSFPPA